MPEPVTREQESARLQEEYTRRESSAALGMYSFENPAYVFHVQELEWVVLKMLRDHGIRLADTRVLDVGSGRGDIPQWFREWGAKDLTCVELLESRVQEGRAKYPGLDLRQGDATALEFEDESFDLTSQFGCFTSLLDPGVRRQAAAEMWRVTRPGGAVLHWDLRPTSAPVRLAGRLLQRVRPTVLEELTTKPIGRAEYRQLFPRGELDYRVVALNIILGAVAARSRFAAQLLYLLPALRTHALVLIRKPG